jgi:GTP diphosphokinase / guanosine-3',5'-bis(diphosphate) 3'-diphosphatase
MENLLAKLTKTYSSNENFSVLEKAYELAKKAHAGQVRLSGEPYFIHPYEVANILIDLGLDLNTVAAGLLHDVMEDTIISDDEIIKEFGEKIYLLVDGVTKLTKVDYKSREEREAESFRKMFLAMAKDVRVILIKLADRLHNMRTLKFQSKAKQFLKATETLEIYAPLAHRLGIGPIKWELEDLALKYLEPKAYNDIINRIEFSREESEEYINKIIKQMKEGMESVNIIGEIVGRPKHIYSIYNKMVNRGIAFDDIYDKVAIRIIVDTVSDCYGVMGILHTKWKPISGRFKDYIAIPKKNDYKSIHTTLLGENGRPFEVQIRTAEMHKQAEYGVAAHWKYKEGKDAQSDLDNKISWVRELLENEDEYKDSKEFMASLKIDLFRNEVFVFTPQGDVKDLPMGATPIDFAYRIHSEVGNKCTGAKVNEKIVPLDYELQTGDVVSIITSQNKTPSRDWLKVAKTHQARSKIKAWFKKELKDENIIKGKSMLEEEAKFRGYSLKDLIKPEWVKGVFKKFMLKSNDDMYAAVGYGGITTGQVLNKLVMLYKKENVSPKSIIQSAKDIAKKKSKANSGGVTVKGESGMLVRYAKCCTPVPGDDIVGYITRGRGVSVHRSDCTNINNNDLEFEEHRLIEVAWTGQEKPSYNLDIQIRGDDRDGLLSDITQLMFTLNFSIMTANARRQKNGVAVIELGLIISNKTDLEKITKKVKEIKGVIEIIRLNK